MTSQRFGHRSLIGVQVGAGFPEEKGVLREACIGGQEERGAACAIAEVHGAALREEEVEDLN
jgi:hypothetical protein